MALSQKLVSVLRALTRRDRVERELDWEIDDWLEALIEEKVASGLSAEEARRAARLEFGGRDHVKEQVRDVWPVAWLDHLLQDVRFGQRTLRRSPGFTTVVVLTLALVIGLNSAVFSVFDAVLLRPVSYPNSDRLVWLTTVGTFAGNGEFVILPDFLDWRDQASSFEGMTAYQNGRDYLIASSDDAWRARIAAVSVDFWALSGARTALGRLPNTRVGELVLTQRSFEQWFDGDPTVVGRTVTANGRDMTIVGVLPNTFRFQLPQPRGENFELKELDGYVSLGAPRPPGNRSPSPPLVRVVAKLKSGISIEQARTDLQTIRARIAFLNPGYLPDEAALRIVPLREQLIGDARMTLWTLQGAVVLVLLIGCANVASLLLARSSARRKEFATRAALGASRARLFGQHLVEALLLALAGGAAGLVLTRGALAVILSLFPLVLPQLAQASIDGRVLLFTLGMSVGAALLFGVSPAFALLRGGVHAGLQDGVAPRRPLTSSVFGRGLLVATEVALALVLLTGAGLMVKSFWVMNTHPAGFEPDQLLTMKIQLFGPQYRPWAARRAYADELAHRLQEIPGLEVRGFIIPSVGLVEPVVEGARVRADQSRKTVLTGVSPELLGAMGMRLVRGRWFTDADLAGVVLINESAVQRYFPDQDPLGQTVRIVRGPYQAVDSNATVIGVVADLRHTQLDAVSAPELFGPYTAEPGLHRFTVVARTSGNPLEAAPTFRRALSELDASQPIYDIETMEHTLADTVASRRFNLYMLGTFAGAAVLLALIGVYGVTAYSVARRRHELGVRMALGAQRGDIVRLVLGEGTGAMVAGLGIGLLAAIGLTRVMDSLVYGVTPTDPQTFLAVSGLLIVSTLMACGVPALKATRVDALRELRNE